ncbi:glycosyltransferase involved in cell wall biosynthesis [Bradyrhizobium sp. S3.3.6]|uniref:Glycosyltransferase family 2 protein n=1 Tax=Bradyrhizobium cytisi TaxID=515489 RepID=A0A5S4W560_9BRAD|nr:glycosyltransferase family 2 protein [Bradyrhizobium cytisi]TYL73227.1 glycosyltransferase family 2 protein [Bradyrhizobium cytisi]
MTDRAIRDLWITACIPTYRCNSYLYHSVTSLLEQSHRKIRVIVVSDGDPTNPWPILSQIDDPRLIRFDLGENRGPYFCRAVAAAATEDPFLLVQDADDWSVPTRVETLLNKLCTNRSDYAFSTLRRFHDRHDRIEAGERIFSAGPQGLLDQRLQYRAPHHGLFRRSSLAALGGFYGGFKFGYDVLLTNLFLLAGSVSWTSEVLYWRRMRPDSLTSAATTGLGSHARLRVNADLKEMYRHCHDAYANYLHGKIDGKTLLRFIRARIEAKRGASCEHQIRYHAARLRSIMHDQRYSNSRIRTV